MPARSLKEIIETIAVKDPLVQKGFQFSRLEKAWGGIVGEELAKQCQPEQLKLGTLWLSTRHPAWTQQIHFYQTALVEKINAFFHKNVVKHLRCNADGRTQPAFALRSATASAGRHAEHGTQNKTSFPQARVLSRAEITFSEEDEIVSEPGLRERFLNVWRKARGFIAGIVAQKKACRMCEKDYYGTHPNVCPLCEDKERVRKRHIIEKLLWEAPWTSYKDATKELKTINELLFQTAKENILDRTSDLLRRQSFDFLEKPQKTKIRPLKQLILQYVSLRGGLTPDKIHAKIIEQTIGKRRFRLLRMKGVAF